MKSLHKMHRKYRNGTSRLFCGDLVERVSPSRGPDVPVYWRTLQGKMLVRAVPLNSALRPTCAICLSVENLR